ncbi:aprataxin and PNK-like factor isoform X2 [Zophobas morio]|uniref:aprataxin and PNK-like factor isoform X2 n=1 Tax=Zophobas morio TaxID=2755281 RepID=UPI003082E3DC
MLVKLFKLGEDEVITTFTQGSHVLGRGTSLQCNDKRISRNHATIEVTPDNITLTSIHVNPCFLRAAESKTITILKKDATTQLHDGDNFALLPDDFWFKIKICEESSSEIEPKNFTSKRCSPDLDDAPPDKKIKTQNDNCDTNNSDVTNVEVLKPKENPNDSENGTTLEENGNSKVAWDNQDVLPKGDTAENKDAVPENIGEVQQVDEGTSQTDQATSKQDQNDQPTANQDDVPQIDPVTAKQDHNGQSTADKDDGNPSTSNSKPKRERCWYGAQCYRKNPVHRQDYTHPGDSDYESDPDDNRPTCSYGATCYRKNKDHRREYKHPSRDPPSKKKRNRKKVERLNVATSQEMREFDDSEDPFINDDDSDEYNGSSYEEDSDWDESQEADEDAENVKRLVKEANRFVKK